MSLRPLRAQVMLPLATALARSPGVLSRAMRHFSFRKALGPEARVHAFRLLGATIGEDVFIGARVAVRDPAKLTVGAGTLLNGAVWIDSWWPVAFGENVIVGDEVLFLAGGHDINSPTFAGTGAPIAIGDNAWLPVRIVVLAGCDIGVGAVVGSGSVVTAPVADYAVVAGNPAKIVGERELREYSYTASRIWRG